jgi:hypothetical protein
MTNSLLGVLKNSPKAFGKKASVKKLNKIITHSLYNHHILKHSMYKLRDWIPEKNLNFEQLSGLHHDGIVPILERHMDQVLMSANAHQNPAAIPLFYRYPEKISWSWMSLYPHALMLLEKRIKDNPDNSICVTWPYVCQNRGAAHILRKHPRYITWDCLSLNASAIDLLEENLDKVNWYNLSSNEGAIHILEQNLGKINWQQLSRNRKALRLWRLHPKKLDWYYISTYPEAIHLIEENLDKVHWEQLSRNEAAIHLLEQNLDKINWVLLSRNPAAIPILEKHLDKVYWFNLALNVAAISIIEQNLDKISWAWLSANPAAIHLLEKHRDRIDWYQLSKNPAIFVYDYEEMKKRCSYYKEELIEVVFHPKNYSKFASWGYEEFQ